MKAISETYCFEEYPKLLEGKYTFAQVEIPEIIANIIDIILIHLKVSIAL